VTATADVPRGTPPRKLSPEVRRSLARVKDGTCSETDFQRVVMAYARDHGWATDHRERARVKGGRWVTPSLGHPGYPDATFVRQGRLVVVELKIVGGRLSDGQEMWLDRLSQVPCVETHIWWPRHWLDGTVRTVLR
jgi:hypothetical protein